MNNINSMEMPPQRMPAGMYGGPGGNMDSIGGPGDPMGDGMPPGMNPGQNPMMMNQPGPGMMRGMRPRMPMGGNGPPFPNSNMPFGGPPKGPGDQAQPLPPSMQGMNPGGMPPNFKGGYGAPNTNDPNYAQQYHNFQQQLYATNTRGQLSQQSFFAPNK